MRRIIIAVFIFLMSVTEFSIASQLAKPVKQKAVLKTDSTFIVAREFSAKSLNAYANQPEFQYNDQTTGPSLWTRFWRWFWHLFDFFKLNVRPSSGFFKVLFFCLKYLVIIAGVAAIVFFIFKLAGIDVSGIFNRKSRSAGLPYAESSENIHEIDFDTEIENATARHNYRLAVRLLYLKCLKQLSDAALITWQPEKTNDAYVNELGDKSERDYFKALTRQFEYVWYGEFTIDGNVFNNIKSGFQKFKIGQG